MSPAWLLLPAAAFAGRVAGYGELRALLLLAMAFTLGALLRRPALREAAAAFGLAFVAARPFAPAADGTPAPTWVAMGCGALLVVAGALAVRNWRPERGERAEAVWLLGAASLALASVTAGVLVVAWGLGADGNEFWADKAFWPALPVAAAAAALLWISDRPRSGRVALVAMGCVLVAGGVRVVGTWRSASAATESMDFRLVAAQWAELGELRREVSALLQAWDLAPETALLDEAQTRWGRRGPLPALERRRYLGRVLRWSVGACGGTESVALADPRCELQLGPGAAIPLELDWTDAPDERPLLVALGHTRIAWIDPRRQQQRSELRLPQLQPAGLYPLQLSLRDPTAPSGLEKGAVLAWVRVGEAPPPRCEPAIHADGEGGLLKDGSFEGDGAWTLRPQPGYRVRRVEGCAAHGRSALAWEFPGGSDPNAYDSFQELELEAGRYEISYWIRAEGFSAGPGGGPRIEVLARPSNRVLLLGPEIGAEAAWSRHRSELRLDLAQRVRLRLRRYGRQGPGVDPKRGAIAGLIYWDGLRVERIE